jgi:hypothetical protein
MYKMMKEFLGIHQFTNPLMFAILWMTWMTFIIIVKVINLINYSTIIYVGILSQTLMDTCMKCIVFVRMV